MGWIGNRKRWWEMETQALTPRYRTSSSTRPPGHRGRPWPASRHKSAFVDAKHLIRCTYLPGVVLKNILDVLDGCLQIVSSLAASSKSPTHRSRCQRNREKRILHHAISLEQFSFFLFLVIFPPNPEWIRRSISSYLQLETVWIR